MNNATFVIKRDLKKRRNGTLTMNVMFERTLTINFYQSFIQRKSIFTQVAN